jgi:membrane-associated phospholipid phosphatase
MIDEVTPRHEALNTPPAEKEQAAQPEAAQRGLAQPGPAGTSLAEPGPDAAPKQPTQPARPTSRWQAAPWWAAPAALWSCFLLLVWQVLAHGPVTRLDVAVRNGIQHWATMPSLSWALPIGRDLADLGDHPGSIVVLVVAALAAALLARSWRPLVPAAGIGLGLLAVVPLKIWIGRPGPGTVVLGDAALGFFPSGHTSDAFLCYGGAALVVCRAFRPPRWVIRALAGFAAALVLLTIAGLLWSDYHWLSDTVGSLCWCGGVMCLVGRLPEHLVRPPTRPGPLSPARPRAATRPRVRPSRRI